MMQKPIMLDTQLLVLLTIGLTDTKLIAKHRGAKSYTVEDYQLLRITLGVNFRLILLPNIVSEAANFLRQHKNPERDDIMEVFATLITRNKEHFVRSRDVAQHLFYLQLGVADSAILQCCLNKYEILTGDLKLFLAAQQLEIDATNFTHIREEAGTI